MSLKALVNAVYNAHVNTASVRYRQEPTGAAGVAVADDAAWDQIIAQATVATDYWLAGLNIGTPAGGGADSDEVIADGMAGTDGAANAAGTLLVECQACYQVVTAAGELYEPPWMLPIPIFVPLASNRNAARISSSTTGGFAITLGITYMTGIGA